MKIAGLYIYDHSNTSYIMFVRFIYFRSHTFEMRCIFRSYTYFSHLFVLQAI